MNDYNFSKKLTALRTAKGLTQTAVAEALGISDKTLSKWENGSSSPDISMLATIAEYYDVSADELLGLTSTKTMSPESAIKKEFDSLSKADMMLRSFELCKELLVSGFSKMSADNVNVTPDHIIHSGSVRSVLETNSMYQRFINSDDVNMFVLEMKSASNFSWLLDEEKCKEISSLFRFLSDPDTSKLIYQIHRDDFPVSFTAEYAAKKTGISTEKAASLLDDATEIAAKSGLSFIHKKVAHLISGEVDIYTSYGSGTVLSLYSLACDLACGANRNCYYYGGSTKMIGGAEK